MRVHQECCHLFIQDEYVESGWVPPIGSPSGSPGWRISQNFLLRKVDGVDISVPEVFLGGIAGATLVFYFSGQCMTAVGGLAGRMSRRWSLKPMGRLRSSFWSFVSPNNFPLQGNTCSLLLFKGTWYSLDLFLKTHLDFHLFPQMPQIKKTTHPYLHWKVLPPKKWWITSALSYSGSVGVVVLCPPCVIMHIYIFIYTHIYIYIYMQIQLYKIMHVYLFSDVM
jgi:hypothetical protein